jgi:hypothetical protein
MNKTGKVDGEITKTVLPRKIHQIPRKNPDRIPRYLMEPAYGFDRFLDTVFLDLRRASCTFVAGSGFFPLKTSVICFPLLQNGHRQRYGYRGDGS